jgi:hypothetical protein
VAAPVRRRRHSIDPGNQIAFSFYNDQLFRVLIDYDHALTDGMTEADMVEAISTMYGAPAKPLLTAVRAPLAGIEQESGTRDTEYTAVLHTSPFVSRFRLIVTSIQLNALARTAEAQAVRLDERDAPQRERARQQQEADAERAPKEKTRLANKAASRP